MRKKRILILTALVLLLCCAFSATAFAAGTGDVASAVESTWKTASGQIKTVVNNVVFPAIDLILAVFFFAKLGTAYFDFRKSGQFEWTSSRHPVRLPGVHIDGSAVHLADHRNLRYRQCLFTNRSFGRSSENGTPTLLM